MWDGSKGDVSTNPLAIPSLNVSGAASAGSLAVSGAASAASLGVSGLTTLAGVGSSVPKHKYNAVTTSVGTNNIPLAAAALTGGADHVIADVTTVISAACTLTLPTVAAVVAAAVAAGLNPVAGSTWLVDIYNDQSGAYNFTLTADSGVTWTLAGTAQTIAKGTLRRFLFTLTSLTAGTIQSLGAFTVLAAP